MGLDMYLRGEKFFWTDWREPKNNLMEDGFKVSTKELEIGYWHKHPNLHGYIIKNFAKGVDDCEKVPLSAKDLEQVLGASADDVLPVTEGFFFGASCDEDKLITHEILIRAIKWLKTEEKGVSRSVYYLASW